MPVGKISRNVGAPMCSVRLAQAHDRGHTHSVGPRTNGEVYEYLVGSPAFKAGDASDPRMAGSIPVHLRHTAKRVQMGTDPI